MWKRQITRWKNWSEDKNRQGAESVHPVNRKRCFVPRVLILDGFNIHRDDPSNNLASFVCVCTCVLVVVKHT